jgi:DNA polymerase
MSFHVDFETFSKIDLTKVGSYRYAEDKSTEPLCISFSDGPAPPTKISLYKNKKPLELEPLFNAVIQGVRLCAHNSEFERNIWEKVCAKYGWPIPKSNQWKCTAAKAAAAAYPRSLQNACIAVGLKVNKDPRGTTLIRKFCKLQKNGMRVLPSDAPEEFEALLRYNQQDVVAERALDLALPDLIPLEERFYRLNYRVNDRGIPIDVHMVRRAQGLVEEFNAELEREVLEMTGLKATQRDKLLEWLQDAGEDMQTLQAQEVELKLVDPETPPEVKRVLEIRLEASRAGIKKLIALLGSVSADDRIRGSFMFHAATTGRWASLGVQFHNFPKGEVADQDIMFAMLAHPQANIAIPMVFDRPLAALSKAMRGFIAAPEGRDLMVADYSAIEARVLAWIADEEFILEQYRGEGKVYEAMASALYNIPMGQVNSHQRFVGKQVILGAGYMEGWAKFIIQCKKFGVTITPQFAKETIAGYRANVPFIVQFWSAIENAALRCVHTGKDQAFARGRLLFRMNGKNLQLKLPSGRPLTYPSANIKMVEKFGRQRAVLHHMAEYKHMWIEEQTYGGKLTENVVQAMSRDLLAEGMVRAELNGYPVMAHVHDEVQSEIEEGTGDVKELERLICILPEWANGLPIAAEGYRAKRYKKQ